MSYFKTVKMFYAHCVLSYWSIVVSGPNCEINNNECASNPCRNRATCEDGINEFTCICEPGFTGNLPFVVILTLHVYMWCC